MKKTVLAVALMTVTGAASAAVVNSGGVFNMYSQQGLDTDGVVSGFNAPINVDATINGFVDETAGTWGVASTAPFYGLTWTATGGTLITGAGSYSLNTTSGSVSSVGSCTVANDGNICFTIGAGQAAGAIDFAWSVNTGIRVVNVWDINGDGSLTAAVVPGMENGPFGGFNAAFNFSAAGLMTPPSAIPVPAAVWLLGSGLIGLVGVARRKKAA